MSIVDLLFLLNSIFPILNSTPLDVLHGLVKLRLFAAKVPGAPLMGILFGTAICWIEGFCRGPEHSVFGYPFGTDGDRWDMGLSLSVRGFLVRQGIPTYREMISTRVGNGSSTLETGVFWSNPVGTMIRTIEHVKSCEIQQVRKGLPHLCPYKYCRRSVFDWSLWFALERFSCSSRPRHGRHILDCCGNILLHRSWDGLV